MLNVINEVCCLKGKCIYCETRHCFATRAKTVIQQQAETEYSTATRSSERNSDYFVRCSVLDSVE